MHEEEHFFICIWQTIGENFDSQFLNGQRQWIVEQFMVLNERRHKSQFKLLSIAFNCAKNEWSYVRLCCWVSTVRREIYYSIVSLQHKKFWQRNWQRQKYTGMMKNDEENLEKWYACKLHCKAKAIKADCTTASAKMAIKISVGGISARWSEFSVDFQFDQWMLTVKAEWKASDWFVWYVMWNWVLKEIISKTNGWKSFQSDGCRTKVTKCIQKLFEKRLQNVRHKFLKIKCTSINEWPHKGNINWITIIYGTTEARNQVQFITTKEQVNLLERQFFHGNMFSSRRRRRCGRKGEQLSEEINSYTTRSWFGILKKHKR